MASSTLPGYRIRIGGGPWREVRTPRFVVGSSPRADLVLDAAAPRHLRLELDDDRAVVRAVAGPVTIDGVPVLAAPIADRALLVVAGVEVHVERGAPWTLPAIGADGRDPLAGPDGVAGLDGHAPLRRVAIAALAGDGPLVIEGDAGTGTSTAALAVHARSGGPWVEVDCRGDLDAVEPRLFGSAMARLGPGGDGVSAFGEARGGTLVLDRVDRLDPSLHTRLVTALDRSDDVRIIATAHDLDASDLAAPLQDRLGVRRAWLPPLVAMADDLLAFARRFAADADAGAELPRDLPRILGARPWRGNLRELRAFMSRLVRL